MIIFKITTKSVIDFYVKKFLETPVRLKRTLFIQLLIFLSCY